MIKPVPWEGWALDRSWTPHVQEKGRKCAAEGRSSVMVASGCPRRACAKPAGGGNGVESDKWVGGRGARLRRPGLPAGVDSLCEVGVRGASGRWPAAWGMRFARPNRWSTARRGVCGDPWRFAGHLPVGQPGTRPCQDFIRPRPARGTPKSPVNGRRSSKVTRQSGRSEVIDPGSDALRGLSPEAEASGPRADGFRAAGPASPERRRPTRFA